ncbi:CvfB family protein [Anaerostipes sp.]|uniref:CvfB family protein n=1 Tax=Anaerostipes sp. TaxID=1872530 RepID=UPI0025C06F30|nr:S1-like domain-containing RNA-binding protein [Anaerostipes sp.]MBS7006921.1 S1 RNA-binding domain-containing protein [Anaerostipes sp.]
MIRLGENQELYIVKFADFGAYLNDEEGVTEQSILLPKKQVPEGAAVGDCLSVFVYKDSKDRPIATTSHPLITIGHLAVLTVKEVTDIGAFLDWGLEKDLFLPFKEQTSKVKPGHSYLVRLYIDKSQRLCASMKIYQALNSEHDYVKDDWVSGTVYSINPEIGTFVAVDDQYFGLIPLNELHTKLSVGDTVSVRVIRVREDGKLDLSPRNKAYLQMDTDSELVLETIKSYDGVLPFTDKADPAVIDKELGLSKNAFKRAVGRLLKQDKIEIKNGTIRIK